MSETPWTIGALAHAPPVPELRQDFLREAQLATLDDLPAVFAKWAGVDDGSTDDFLARLEADTRRRRGSNAA